MTAPRARTIRPPRWPMALLVLFFLLATLSLAQGIVDVVLPVIRGEPSFGFLFSMTERFGPGFFVGYIFLHNLGLACLVPGYGFVAARFERNKPNRFIIGILLAASVVASLFVALHFVLTTQAQEFNIPFALALLTGEACGVLALAFAGARELRGFVPTRAYAWSLVTPFRRLRVPLSFSLLVLLGLSLWEGWAVLGA